MFIFNKISCSKIFLTFIFLCGIFSGEAQTNRRNTTKIVPYRSNYQRFSAGNEHALEIRDGAIWSWGDNGWGEIGDGTNVMRPSPVQVGTLTDWVSVEAGGSFSLAIKADGTLWSWGGNAYGTLGDGTTIQHYLPAQVGAANNWISVSAGYDNAYGIKSDGTLWAWGWNAYGQLGDGTTTQRNAPVQIGAGNTWVKVSAGYAHVLALKADGTLWAWGENNHGQVGDGTLVNKSTPVQIGAGTSWESIAAGNTFSAALRADGTIWSWGDNGAGSLGDGTTTQRTSPVQAGTATDWVSISVTGYTSLGLKSNGTFWAWGDNTFGEMGNGTTTLSSSPLQIGTATDWVAFEGGELFALGLKANGTVSAWGRNNTGQIGNGVSGTVETSPVQISGSLSGWLSISAGWKHTIAIKENGTLWGWGENSYGQVGDGTTIQRTSPVQIGVGTNWIGVATGYNFSLAIKSDGTLWAWGENTYGELGDATTVSKSSPVQVGTANNWTTVTAGTDFSVGLKSDGTLWTWGRDNVGQQGTSYGGDRSSPGQVGVANTWTSISAGAQHVLALRSNGTLWSWGFNFNGQLGNGGSGGAIVPTQQGIVTNWVGLYASEANSHGIKSDGTRWSWGANSSGQLGDGTTTSKNAPTQMGALSTWLVLSPGWQQTTALKADGTYWGWGRNDIGQLGDNTLINKSTPIQIGTLSNWTFITPGQGQSHSLSIKSDRAQYCYTGNNSNGELGDCSLVSRNVINCIGQQPMIMSDPVNVSICPFNNATFTITADNATTYQWQDNGVNITSGAYAGFNTNSLTVLAAGASLNGHTYRCIVSVSGGCPPPDTSAAGTLTIYTLPSVSANASPSASVCAGQSVTLTGGGASTYTWSSGVTNGVAFTPVSTATYTVTGTDIHGCQNNSNIIITVNPLPTISSTSSPSGAVCSGSATTLNGSGGVSYTWTGGVTNGVTFFPTATSTYTVTGTDGNGCQNTATRTITVNPLPTVTANALPSNSICMGQIVTLNGGGASSYTWTGGAGGIFNGVGFQPMSTATYTVSGTDGNGCVNTNSITVTVNSLPTVGSTASPSASICSGQSVMLNGTGANSYTWTGGVFNGVPFTPGSSLTYTVTGTDLNGCQNTSTKTITVKPLPVVAANVSPSQTVCSGQNITLSGSGASTYVWNGGVVNGTAFPATVSATYVVQGTAPNGCQSKDSIDIIVNPLPSVTVSSPDNNICSGSGTTLTGSGANSYSWSANAGSASTATVSVNPTTTTTYTVTGTDVNSCSNTGTITVNVVQAITPSICLTTVDSALSNHNIIYWDKTGMTGVDSFRIYREVTTGTYAYVVSVAFDSLSEYHDYAANPNVTSYKYKMSVIDSCGNESALSDYHSTIHLQYLGGGNLQWTLYEIEGAANPVTYYRVLRDDLGTGCCYLPISSTIPGGNSTFTDIAYASFPNANYRVDVTWGIGCSPTRASVNTTRSNIKQNGLFIGMNEDANSSSVKIYPNPATGNVNIELKGMDKNVSVQMYNVMGQLMDVPEKTTANDGLRSFDISGFAKGVYSIVIEEHGNKVYRKLVVN